MARIDIDEALADEQTNLVLSLWADARHHADAPPFSGGVLDAWPALAVDGFAVCRQEDQAIDDYLRHLEQKEGGHG